MSYSSDPYYPEFQEPPTYLQPPPASTPPPPRRREKKLALLLLCGALLIGGSFSAYIVLAHGQIQSPSSASSTSTSTRTTPTLDARAALVTNDFSQFLQAFTVLLTRRDYATIQTATDTQNFQEIPLRADGIADWHEMYHELTTGALSLTIPPSPLNPDQAGYSCFGYSASGISYLSIKIDALQLQYVVGTAHAPGTSANEPINDHNGTVFVFELPNEPSPTWFWRAVTFNNSLGCN